MTKINMKQRILNHLEKYGTITSLEAINKYGCTRLSHYIWLLRKEYEIKSVYKVVQNRYGVKKPIAIYTLIKN